MDIKDLSAILLVGQIISVGFIFSVLRLQFGLFKTTIQHDLVAIRRVLFHLAMVIFLGNLIPIVINALTITGAIYRPVLHGRLNFPAIIYTSSNTGVAVASALLIWLLYRMASKVLVIVDHDKAVALNKREN